MTNTAKHTLWYAAQADNTIDMWEIYEAETDTIIAENITEVHASLIAAAPELLEALHKAVDQMAQCERMFRDDEDFIEALTEARAAIAKAEGK